MEAKSKIDNWVQLLKPQLDRLKKGGLLPIFNKGKFEIETESDIEKMEKVILYKITIKAKQENMEKEEAQQAESVTRQNSLKAGYSSHGEWSTLGEVKIVEAEERGNGFPDLSAYPENTPTIWVCRTKRKALRYLALAEDWDLINDTSKPLPKRLRNLLIEIAKVPLQPSDITACDDGNEGCLILRPKAQPSVNELFKE